MRAFLGTDVVVVCTNNAKARLTKGLDAIGCFESSHGLASHPGVVLQLFQDIGSHSLPRSPTNRFPMTPNRYNAEPTLKSLSGIRARPNSGSLAKGVERTYEYEPSPRKGTLSVPSSTLFAIRGELM